MANKKGLVAYCGIYHTFLKQMGYLYGNLSRMDLQTLFQEAVASSKDLKERPSNDTLLQLYSLYKQATEGDNLSDPPSNPFDFVAKAKFEAWAERIGMSKEDAMQSYIALVNKLRG